MVNIALIAHDKKKELMVEFCIAYSGILKKHNLCATGATGACVMEGAGLEVKKYLSGAEGGVQQIGARIAYNEIDLVLFFDDPIDNQAYVMPIIQLCDAHTIPVATNIATAEMLVLGLDRGDLSWRDIVNPKKTAWTRGY